MLPESMAGNPPRSIVTDHFPVNNFRAGRPGSNKQQATSNKQQATCGNMDNLKIYKKIYNYKN